MTNQIDTYNPVKVDADYMAEHLDQQDALYEIIRSRPIPIVNVLFDPRTPTVVETLCRRFNLTDAQSVQLSHLIRDVMLAQTYIANLIPELTSRLDLPEPRARELADALAAELFAPAKDDLKALHAQVFGSQHATQQGNVINLKK